MRPLETDFEIIVPYGGANPHREAAKEHVLQYLGSVCPEVYGHLVTSDVRPFPKAQLVNHAVHEVTAPVVLLVDADTVVPAAQILEAVRLAGEAPGLVFAFDHYQRLTRAATARVLAGEHCHPGPSWIEWSRHDAGSHGCIVVQRESFLAVDGYDERFAGWGYEDLDLNRRMAERWPLRRVPGDLYHLWHGERRDDDSPLDADPRHVQMNWILFNQQPDNERGHRFEAVERWQ